MRTSPPSFRDLPFLAWRGEGDEPVWSRAERSDHHLAQPVRDEVRPGPGPPGEAVGRARVSAIVPPSGGNFSAGQPYVCFARLWTSNRSDGRQSDGFCFFFTCSISSGLCLVCVQAHGFASKRTALRPSTRQTHTYVRFILENEKPDKREEHNNNEKARFERCTALATLSHIAACHTSTLKGAILALTHAVRSAHTIHALEPGGGGSQVRVYRYARADRGVHVECFWADHHGDSGVCLPNREYGRCRSVDGACLLVLRSLSGTVTVSVTVPLAVHAR